MPEDGNTNSIDNERFELTRRQFVLGTAGVALAIVGTTAIMSGCSSDSDDTDVEELQVAEDQVVSSADFTELDTAACAVETRSFDLPMGSVGHMDGDDLAVMLYPGDTPDVLTQMGLLAVTSGAGLTTVLDRAVSHDEKFVIYDARANDKVAAWVECNLYSNDWRMYIAPVLSVAEIGTPVLVDQGDSDFDPPMLAVSGTRAFWTVVPNSEGGATDSDTYLKCASVSAPRPEIAYTSRGSIVTNPQASDGIVTLVPHPQGSSWRCQMTAINAQTLDVVAAQVLPSSMQAYDAIYLDGSFVFGIENSYDYGGGISRFGTYASRGNGSYMRFNRTPMDTPSRCGNYLVVKSTKNVVGVDMANQSYFAIDTIAGCESYGDFLLSTGTCDKIVTYTSLPAGDGSGNGVVRVRGFETL